MRIEDRQTYFVVDNIPSPDEVTGAVLRSHAVHMRSYPEHVGVE